MRAGMPDGGAWNSTRPIKPKYAPGETIELRNITIENPGRHDIPHVRLRAYLDSGDDLHSLLDEANCQDLGKIPAGSLLTGPPPSNIYYQWDTVEAARYWTGTVTFQIPEDMPSGTYRVHLVVTANDDDPFWEDTTHGNNHTFMHDPIEVVCPKPAAPGNFAKVAETKDGVFLRWDAVDNAQYFLLQRKKNPLYISQNLFSLIFPYQREAHDRTA